MPTDPSNEQSNSSNNSPLPKPVGALSQARNSAVLLAGFAVITTALLALSENGLRERISNNEEAALLETLNAIVPANRYNNNIATSRITLPANAKLGSNEPSEAFVAKKNGTVVAYVLPSTAPKGYSGPITLLTGVYRDGSVAGVRVVSHQETPGLGDKIERKKSEWVLGFNDKKMGQPSLEDWAVQKDGGDFDQLTGATITPRAVVSAVRDTLLYFDEQKTTLQTLAAEASNAAPANSSNQKNETEQ